MELYHPACERLRRLSAAGRLGPAEGSAVLRSRTRLAPKSSECVLARRVTLGRSDGKHFLRDARERFVLCQSFEGVELSSDASKEGQR